MYLFFNILNNWRLDHDKYHFYYLQIQVLWNEEVQIIVRKYCLAEFIKYDMSLTGWEKMIWQLEYEAIVLQRNKRNPVNSQSWLFTYQVKWIYSSENKNINSIVERNRFQCRFKCLCRCDQLLSCNPVTKVEWSLDKFWVKIDVRIQKNYS